MARRGFQVQPPCVASQFLGCQVQRPSFQERGLWNGYPLPLWYRHSSCLPESLSWALLAKRQVCKYLSVGWGGEVLCGVWQWVGTLVTSQQCLIGKPAEHGRSAGCVLVFSYGCEKTRMSFAQRWSDLVLITRLWGRFSHGPKVMEWLRIQAWVWINALILSMVSSSNLVSVWLSPSCALASSLYDLPTLFFVKSKWDNLHGSKWALHVRCSSLWFPDEETNTQMG